MTAVKKLRLLGAFAFVSFVTTALLVACGSDDSNPTPVTPVFTVDASGTTDSSLPGSGNDGAPGSNADTGTLADTGPLADVDAAGCTGDGGCWIAALCTPTTTPEFLNECTGSTCSPFDNTRVPNYDGGILKWNP